LETDFLKLGASTVTLYCPGGRRLKTYSPKPFVCKVRAADVAVFTTVTLALGTTAPAASVTVPKMSAVVS